MSAGNATIGGTPITGLGNRMGSIIRGAGGSDRTGRSIVTGDVPSFSLSLLASLVPEIWSGSNVPTYTRATTAYQTDFEGKLNLLPSGAARLQGARYVRNLISATSEDFSNAAWVAENGTKTTGIADPLGGTKAMTFTATAGNGDFYNVSAAAFAGKEGIASIWIRRRTGNGTVKIFPPDIQPGSTISPTASWKRFASVVSGPSGSAFYLYVQLATSGDAVDVAFGQIEDVTGQTNQNPSEYVSVGSLSAPYHGAGVDGVAYFDYLNPNTVVDNVVVEG